MNKILSFIKDVIRIVNKATFVCTLLMLAILVLSQTPITIFCAGWCSGLFVCDTMHRYINDKYR